MEHGQALTVRTVADLLSVSDGTVRRWADSGVLPAYKLPSGHRRFDPVTVLRFRETLRKPASPGAL
jgi:excisionase family DNA binding protein